MRIYFAGPLFCQAEKEFNSKVTSELRSNGFDVYLPQENSSSVTMPEDAVSKHSIMKGFFDDDIKAIDSSDVLLIVMDGRVPDEGACFELGYAYAKGKVCVGLKTDLRVSEFGTDNAMLIGSLEDNIVRDVPSLITLLKKIETA